jgi:NadR type nicotinamide-nucleotide adenylyltransferase
VFTSETYGEGFALELTEHYRTLRSDYPTVRHVLVDLDRALVPISGTQLRADVHHFRRHLSPEVYASFVERVVLLGGESSGKSTLAVALAGHFGTRHVAEYGRELWEAQRGALTFDDMTRIATEQVRREEATLQHSRRYLFCDTSPLTTLVYSRLMFSKVAPSLEAAACRGYHHTVLCRPDFDFVQDGTRRDASFRQRQHAVYTRELEQRNVRYVEASGSLGQRIDQVAAALARSPLPSGSCPR